MNNFDEEKMSKDIKNGLNGLEEKILVNTPDIARFRKMISQVDYNKAKKTKKEAIIFVFVAILGLSIETYAFKQSVMYFIILQGFAGASFIIGLLNWLIKSYRKVKSI